MSRRLTEALILMGSAILAAAALLAGCGGGDTLPLQPASGTCDRPPDPRWRYLAPVRGPQYHSDGAWQDQETVWVVGTGGLAMVKRGDHPFRREDIATSRDLESVVSLADGTMVAVGEGGTVAEHTTEGWTVRQVAGAGYLVRATALGNLAWAVGDSGTVVRRDAGGVWSLLDFSDPVAWAGVAAKADTVAVCGAGGALWLAGPDGWLDLSAGPWLGADLRSVVWLADGRLVVNSSEALYVRGAGGWTTPEFAEELPNNYSIRLQVAGQRLWYFHAWGVLLIDTSGPVWTFATIPNVYYQSAAIRDENTALLVDSSNLQLYHDGILEPPDPANFDDDTLFSLADGTTGCFDQWGLLTVGPEGLFRTAVLPTEAAAALGSYDMVTGRSLDDYLVADRRLVWRIAGGVGTQVAEIPSGSYLNAMAQDGAGRLHLSLSGDGQGLYTCDGGGLQPQLLLGWSYSGPDLMLTRQGTAVARLSGAAWAFHEARWDSLPFLAGDIFAEPEPGLLLSLRMGGLNGWKAWRAGEGLLAEGPIDPAPLCTELYFEGGVDSPFGIFLSTGFPSLVLAPEGERLSGPWDLVAGPLDGEIRELRVLAGGSLLATTWNPRALVIYPAR